MRINKLLIGYILFIAFIFFCGFVSGAEIMFRVGSSDDLTRYQDGDVVSAFTDRKIQWVHAQNALSAYRRANPKLNVARSSGTYYQKALEHIHQYRFERISETEVRRRNLSTDETETSSNTPNASGEYMNVPLYISRRMKDPDHNIFIDDFGNEFWYGGTLFNDQTIVDAVWGEIEAGTLLRQIDATEWPEGLEERRRFRIVKIDSLTEAQAAALVAPALDGFGNVSKIRQFRVDYVNLPRLNAQERIDIADPTVEFDLRAKGVYTRTSIIQSR